MAFSGSLDIFVVSVAEVFIVPVCIFYTSQRVDIYERFPPPHTHTLVNLGN